MSQEIGLFFGSFNPVHIGHLIIADYVRSYSGMRELWFVLSPHNPLKDKASLLGDYDRLHLLHLAIDDNPGFRICDIEFSLPKPSYTIDTLTHLKEKYPGKKFSLIMGEDNLAGLHKWKNSERILEYPIYVYRRSASSESAYAQHPGTHWIDAPLLDLSASRIRECIRQNVSVRYMLPHKVWDYIQANRLYK